MESFDDWIVTAAPLFAPAGLSETESTLEPMDATKLLNFYLPSLVGSRSLTTGGGLLSRKAFSLATIADLSF